MIKTINTGVAEVLCVKVPEDATAWKISGTNYLCSKINGKWVVEVPRLEDFVNWKILGIAHEIKEEVWDNLVEPVFNPEGGIGGYKNYEGYSGWYDTATESGLSLLRANEVFTVNPYGIDPEQKDYSLGSENQNRDYLEDHRNWHVAQQNTGKWVMLKKLI